MSWEGSCPIIFFRDDFQENPYPETQFKMNLGFLYVLIAPAFAFFASFGFLDIFWLVA